MNPAHVLLASMLSAQDEGPAVWRFSAPFCRTIFTTNFDPLLQRALQFVDKLYYLMATFAILRRVARSRLKEAKKVFDAQISPSKEMAKQMVEAFLLARTGKEDQSASIWTSSHPHLMLLVVWYCRSPLRHTEVPRTGKENRHEQEIRGAFDK